MAKVLLNSFNNGEISSKYNGRVNLQAYQNSCQELKNFIVEELGGVYRRPPLKYNLSLSGVSHSSYFPVGDSKDVIEFIIGLSISQTTLFYIDNGSFKIAATYTSGDDGFIPNGTILTYLDESIYAVVNNTLTEYEITGGGATGEITIASQPDTGTTITSVVAGEGFVSGASKSKGQYVLVNYSRSYDNDPNNQINVVDISIDSNYANYFEDFDNNYVGTEGVDFNRTNLSPGSFDFDNPLNDYFLCKVVKEFDTSTIIGNVAGDLSYPPTSGSYVYEKFTGANEDERREGYIDSKDVEPNSTYLSTLSSTGYDALGEHSFDSGMNCNVENFITLDLDSTSGITQCAFFPLPSVLTILKFTEGATISLPSAVCLTDFEGNDRTYTTDGVTADYITPSWDICCKITSYSGSATVVSGTSNIYFYNDLTDSEREDASKFYVRLSYSYTGAVSYSLEIKEGDRFSIDVHFEKDATSSNLSSSVFSFQNRLGLYEDNIIQMSRIGEYDDFTVGTDPDDPLEYELKAGENIRFITDGAIMQISTDKSEYIISAENGVITGDSTKMSINKRSTYGATGVYHETQGALFFMSGKRLRRMTYDYNSNSYYAVDTSVIAEHLFENQISKIISIDDPQNLVVLLTESGELIFFSFDQSLNLSAFSSFESQSSISSMFMANGVVYLEMENPFISGQNVIYELDFTVLESANSLYADFEMDSDDVISASGSDISALYGVKMFLRNESTGEVTEMTHDASTPIPAGFQISISYESRIETSNYVANIDMALGQTTIKRFNQAIARFEEAYDFLIGQDDQVLRSAFPESNETLKEDNDVTIEIGGEYSEEGRIIIEIDSRYTLKIGGLFANVSFYGGVE